MTFRAVYTVWCDGPGGDRCASWIGQEEVRDDVLRVALRSGWHRQNKMHFCPSCFAQISEPKSEAFKAYMIGVNPSEDGVVIFGPIEDKLSSMRPIRWESEWGGGEFTTDAKDDDG